jgi:hypothetical protein
MKPQDKSKELLDGYRQSLADFEKVATVKSVENLKGYERAIQNCLEAGDLVACLRTKNQNICGLYLKRVLNDLRCIWLLIQSGYTSQAATVGASQSENTHVVKLIANKEERAKLFEGTDFAEKLPWRIEEMRQELAKDAIATGQSNSSFDETWKLDYSIYRWFCEIKHTTLRVALLDSGSVSSKEGFVIMVAPDRRDKYTGMKKLLCFLC